MKFLSVPDDLKSKNVKVASKFEKKLNVPYDPFLLPFGIFKIKHSKSLSQNHKNRKRKTKIIFDILSLALICQHNEQIINGIEYQVPIIHLSHI